MSVVTHILALAPAAVVMQPHRMLSRGKRRPRRAQLELGRALGIHPKGQSENTVREGWRC